MPNILVNKLKTSGVGGTQPWRAYYKGIKPVNPMGDNIVRRMGNKVKGVVSSSSNKTMTFSYVGQLTFGYSKDYVPPYVPPEKSVSPVSPEVNYTAPLMKVINKPVIADSEDPIKHRQFETEKEKRRRSAELRARYRIGLDTVREVRSWKNSLGI